MSDEERTRLIQQPRNGGAEYNSLHALPYSPSQSPEPPPLPFKPPVPAKPPLPAKPASAGRLSPHIRPQGLPPSPASPARGRVGINAPSNYSPKNRSNTDQSEISVTSFGGMSILGGEASPRDVQELLDNLDNATRLIRKHIQEEEAQGPAPGEHILVTRPLIPRWITSYLLVITFIWQTINVGFLEAIDAIKTDNSTEHELRLASNIVMTAFQAVHIMLAFFVSYKLVKKVLHRTASGSLLAQSYLSMVLLFAGLYTLEFRFNEGGFKYVFGGDNRTHVTLVFMRMLYFSVSTATLCGTSEVEPVDWYSSLTVSLQMLMSFVYFASILSLGVIPRKKSKNEKDSKSITQRLREWIFKNRNSGSNL